MRLLTIVGVCAATLFLTGCGGNITVTRTSAKAPEQIRSVSFAAQSGNSTEVSSYISEALASQGVATGSITPRQAFKSNDVDAIVSYVDVWRWDIVTYLKSIAISLYNAKTGELLVTGRWSDSLFHTYFRGDSVSKNLINEMFAKLQLNQNNDTESTNVVPTQGGKVDVEKPKPPSVATHPPGSGAKSNETRISRNEYSAREQARTIQCLPHKILNIEGLGTPREEITFDCGEGRKVTIVCRSLQGCS